MAAADFEQIYNAFENDAFLFDRSSFSIMECWHKLYRTPIKFAVQSDCRPPAKYFPRGITVNPGGL